MILAKDLRKKYDRLARAQYRHSTERGVSEIEYIYEALLIDGRYVTGDKVIATEFKEAGYIVKETEYEKHIYKRKVIKGFFSNKYIDEKTDDVYTHYSAEIYIPEEDEQLENKSSYNLVVITSRGGNLNIRLDNMSLKDVKSFVERGYEIGALATETGYISTSIIDKLDIKEIS